MFLILCSSECEGSFECLDNHRKCKYVWSLCNHNTTCQAIIINVFMGGEQMKLFLLSPSKSNPPKLTCFLWSQKNGVYLMSTPCTSWSDDYRNYEHHLRSWLEFLQLACTRSFAWNHQHEGAIDIEIRAKNEAQWGIRQGVGLVQSRVFLTYNSDLGIENKYIETQSQRPRRPDEGTFYLWLKTKKEGTTQMMLMVNSIIVL